MSHLNVETLSTICTVLQFSGFLLLIVLLVGWKKIPRLFGAILSVCGFAGVVKVFLPLPGHQDAFFLILAVGGLVCIVTGCFRVQVK